DSCAADLESCLDALELRAENSDGRVKVFLWQQALISYGRCFATGVRLTIKPAQYVKLLPKEMQDFHEIVIAMRSKFVAHSVNSLEVPLTLYKLSARGKATMFTYNIRMTPESEATPNKLRELAEGV